MTRKVYSMAGHRIKDEFYHFWTNGQPYNQEYAVVDDAELDRLVGMQPAEELNEWDMEFDD